MMLVHIGNGVYYKESYLIDQCHLSYFHTITLCIFNLWGNFTSNFLITTHFKKIFLNFKNSQFHQLSFQFDTIYSLRQFLNIKVMKLPLYL